MHVTAGLYLHRDVADLTSVKWAFVNKAEVLVLFITHVSSYTACMQAGQQACTYTTKMLT